MFQHCVHFWLKPDLSDEQHLAFIDGCRGLTSSPNVGSCRVGVPAGTPRPIVDNTYDVQLTCHFNSRADHDAYQSDGDAVHAAFIERFQAFWERVLIYDSIEA